MLLIRGLYNAEAGKGRHPTAPRPATSCPGAPLEGGGGIHSGVSMGPAAGAQKVGRRDEGAEPGAGLRAVDVVAAQGLFDALQLATSPGTSPTTPTPLELYPALGVRQSVPRRGGQGRRRQCSTAFLDESEGAGQSRSAIRIAASWTSTCPRCAKKSSSASTGPASKAASRGVAAHTRQAEHPPAARRRAAGRRSAHAAHVRHSRPGFPDRHDARLHPQAEQRPLVDALPEPRRGLDDPPPCFRTAKATTG